MCGCRCGHVRKHSNTQPRDLHCVTVLWIVGHSPPWVQVTFIEDGPAEADEVVANVFAWDLQWQVKPTSTSWVLARPGPWHRHNVRSVCRRPLVAARHLEILCLISRSEFIR